MNWLHRRLCASRAWRGCLARDLVPWALDGVSLGGEVLEIGPGPGAATDLLRLRARRLTCVEIDRGLARALAHRVAGSNVIVRCEDATSLASPDGAFDVVLCLMVLHHVAPRARQDRLLAEAARVLRPNGTFVLLESLPSLALRALHIGDTLLLSEPGAIERRLADAGFARATVDVRPHVFRVQATRTGA